MQYRKFGNTGSDISILAFGGNFVLSAETVAALVTTPCG